MKNTRLLRAFVTTIALCKTGKNNLGTLFKSNSAGERKIRLGTVVQKSAATAEKGSLLAVVTAPNFPDHDGLLVDDASVIEQSAHEFLRDHRQLDIEHDGNILGPEAAYVAESFIIGEGDKRFAEWKDYDGNPVDVTGGWAVRIQIDDPELRAAYRDGDWDGVSMFGLAATEPVEKSAASKRVLDRLARSSEGESDMDEAKLLEMFKALGDQMKEGFSVLAQSLSATPGTPDPAPAADPASQAGDGSNSADPVQAAIDALTKPVVPADINSPTAMQRFADEQRAYELTVKQLKGELTAEGIAALACSLSESLPTDEEAGIEQEDTPAERDLKRQLFELRKSRNTPEEVAEVDHELETVRKSRSSFASAISGAYNQNIGAVGSPSSFKKVKA